MTKEVCKVIKHSGDQLAIIVPEELLRQINVTRGDEVKIDTMSGKRLEVEKKGFFQIIYNKI